ncbi:O-antigen ligase family protein [Rosistilla oblonga]|uniref:O-antigen ligase family protein n=1 Tax=Rosistilla oblonga TaxID=2527990 RepID=UPI003A987800
MDDPPSTIERYAGKAFDWALYGVLLVSPLFMGGRGPFGKFVFVCFVSVMAIAWIVQSLCRKTFVLRICGAEWIIAVGGLLLIFQLIPWPESVLLTLSPNLRELLPVWFSSPDPTHVQVGTWNTISLAPHATRQALAVYVAYALFFMLLVQRIRKLDDVEWLLRSLAYGTIGLAVLGLAQFLTSNGKFLWFYEHPFRTTDGVVKGPFQNQNHFAHMMALGIGPLLWMLSTTIRELAKPTTPFKSKRHSRSQFSGKKRHSAVSLEVLAITFGIGLVALAAMLTFSRGGFLAFVAAAFVATGLYRWQNLVHGATLKIAACIGIVVVAALCIYGYEPLAQRLSTLQQSQSLEELSHGRRALWDAMLSATQNFWVTGTGIGSHADVYPVYMSKFYSVDFTHGESGYLPLLMEGGVVAVALLVFAIGLILYRLRPCLRRIIPADPLQSRRGAALASPLCAAIAASLVHSTGDFVWYISACMSWTILVMAVAVRLPNLLQDDVGDDTATSFEGSRAFLVKIFGWTSHFSVSPTGQAITCATCMAMLAFSVTTLWPAARASKDWNDFRVITRNAEHEQNQRSDREIALLKRTLANDPVHRQASLLLAQALWRAENQPKPSDLDVGSAENSNAIQVSAQSLAIEAFSRNPLQGSAYVFALPANALLDQSQTANAILEQALRVRQHDAIVHMVRGKQLIAAGQLDKGFQHWQFAFNHDPVVQASLLEQLRPIFPASFLIEKLEPELAGLWQMYYAYREGAEKENAQLLAKELISRLTGKGFQSEGLATRARNYYALHSLYHQIGDAQQEIEALQHAVEYQPDNYSYRRALAYTLYGQELYSQAAKHFKWCQARRSDDQHLSKTLKECVRRQIAAAAVNIKR